MLLCPVEFGEIRPDFRVIRGRKNVYTSGTEYNITMRFNHVFKLSLLNPIGLIAALKLKDNV